MNNYRITKNKYIKAQHTASEGILLLSGEKKNLKLLQPSGAVLSVFHGKMYWPSFFTAFGYSKSSRSWVIWTVFFWIVIFCVWWSAFRGGVVIFYIFKYSTAFKNNIIKKYYIRCTSKNHSEGATPFYLGRKTLGSNIKIKINVYIYHLSWQNKQRMRK